MQVFRASPGSGLLSSGLMLPVSRQRRLQRFVFLCTQEKATTGQALTCQESVAALSSLVRRSVFAQDCLNTGRFSWSCHPDPAIGEQVQNRPSPLAQLFTWSSQTCPVLSPLALNLIGPRAVDVLSELSYAPMTPDHFPSLFCKVSTGKLLVFK